MRVTAYDSVWSWEESAFLFTYHVIYMWLSLNSLQVSELLEYVDASEVSMCNINYHLSSYKLQYF